MPSASPSAAGSYANAAWPTGPLTDAFRKFSPEIIKAKIEGIDAELERGSFDDAKAM